MNINSPMISSTLAYSLAVLATPQDKYADRARMLYDAQQSGWVFGEIFEEGPTGLYSRQFSEFMARLSLTGDIAPDGSLADSGTLKKFVRGEIGRLTELPEKDNSLGKVARIEGFARALGSEGIVSLLNS